MNNIINFLCLPDNDIEVTNIEISGDTKYVYTLTLMILYNQRKYH